MLGIENSVSFKGNNGSLCKAATGQVAVLVLQALATVQHNDHAFGTDTRVMDGCMCHIQVELSLMTHDDRHDDDLAAPS